MQKALWPADRKAFRDKYLAAAMIGLALFFSNSASAQYDSTKQRQAVNSYGFDWKNGKFGSLVLPTDTVMMAVKDSGAIAYKGGDLWKWDGYVWSQITGSGGGSDSGFQVLFAPLGGVPIAKFIDGGGHRFILFDTTAPNASAILTRGAGQKTIDSMKLINDARYLQQSASPGQVAIANGSSKLVPQTVTGDIGFSSSGVATIPTHTVTNAKAAQMPANTIKGNNTGSTTDAADLTAAQVMTLINGVTNFLGTNFLGYGPHSSHPTTGTGIYYDTDSSMFFYYNAGVASNMTPTFTIHLVQGLQYFGNTNPIDSMGMGNSPFFQADTINTAGWAFLITGLPNKSVALSTDSVVIEDITGKLWKLPVPTGGGGSGAPFADNTALVMNNADNTKLLILSAASIGAGTTKTWTFPNVNGTVARNDAAQTFTGVQTLSSPPIFTGLTGYLKGNNTSAISVVTTIPNADLATMATQTIKANVTGGTASPTDATPAQVAAILPVFGTSANGLVPSPGTVTGKVLSDNATWIAALTNPMTTTNDIIIGGASGAPTRLAAGGANTLLHGNGTYGAVAYADMPTIAAHSYVGNSTGSTAAPAAVSNTNLTADLNIVTNSLKGLVPATGGGTANFFRADETFTNTLTGPLVFNYSGSSSSMGNTFAGTSTNDNFDIFTNGTNYFRFRTPDTTYDAGLVIASKGMASTDSNQFMLTERAAVALGPVATWVPLMPNKWMSMDWVPTDSVMGGLATNNGNTWGDFCNRPLKYWGGVSLNYVGTARIGSYLTHSDFGSVAFGGAPLPDVNLLYGIGNNFLHHSSTGTIWLTPNMVINELSNAYNRVSLINTAAQGSSAGAAYSVGNAATSTSVELFYLSGSSYTSAPFLQNYGGLYAKSGASLAILTATAAPIVIGVSNGENGRVSSTGHLLWGTITDNNAFIQTGANTTTIASMFLNGSAADVTSPTNGMLRYITTGTHHLYFRDGGADVDLLLAGTGGGSSPPFADNTAIAKNNSDNTKLFKFDLSGLTTATTRAWTVPDFAGTFAAINHAQSFTGAQDMTGATLTVATQTAGDNSTNAASTAYVDGMAGTYTPTGSNSSNVGSSTMGTCMWTRVGKFITIFGNVNITSTGNSLNTTIDISVPVAGTILRVVGAGETQSNAAGGPMDIFFDSGNNLIELKYVSAASGGAAAAGFNIWCRYQLN